MSEEQNEQDQVDPIIEALQTAREPKVLDRKGLRVRLSANKFKVEPFEFELDGELLVIDAHEMNGGERVAMLDRARKLHEGKLDGGTQRFYRDMIARVFHVPGTKERVWDAKDDAALIDALPTEVHEALMKKALQINGMDPDSVKNAKNGSAPDA